MYVYIQFVVLVVIQVNILISMYYYYLYNHTVEVYICKTRNYRLENRFNDQLYQQEDGNGIFLHL